MNTKSTKPSLKVRHACVSCACDKSYAVKNTSRCTHPNYMGTVAWVFGKLLLYINYYTTKDDILCARCDFRYTGVLTLITKNQAVCLFTGKRVFKSRVASALEMYACSWPVCMLGEG